MTTVENLPRENINQNLQKILCSQIGINKYINIFRIFRRIFSIGSITRP